MPSLIPKSPSTWHPDPPEDPADTEDILLSADCQPSLQEACFYFWPGTFPRLRARCFNQKVEFCSGCNCTLTTSSESEVVYTVDYRPGIYELHTVDAVSVGLGEGEVTVDFYCRELYCSACYRLECSLPLSTGCGVGVGEEDPATTTVERASSLVTVCSTLLLFVVMAMCVNACLCLICRGRERDGEEPGSCV